ncbi:uncharacterized protein LOC116303761 [Actinia tenebrosa]|uniref:Uncharacterized protein LOC116303761 n=1 Tax=Actinia tenebrosa TaxID=6105 RepID=A0A6P8IQM1_ACTTE|nr:uncharacterized protein LOC116303761 [Actinia tenebrosa]
MALHITLAVFSGLPDPEWQIKQGDPNYQQIYDAFQDAKKNKFTLPSSKMPSRLGYKGLLIRVDRQGPTSLILGPKTKELQKLLLQTAPSSVSKSLVDEIIESIDKGEM